MISENFIKEKQGLNEEKLKNGIIFGRSVQNTGICGSQADVGIFFAYLDS